MICSIRHRKMTKSHLVQVFHLIGGCIITFSTNTIVYWETGEAKQMLYKWITTNESQQPIRKKVNPLIKIPYQHVYSCHCSLYVSYFTDWENLFKHQDNSSLVIISFILMIYTFDQVVILLGEIRCWSLLGLNGLTSPLPNENSE